MRFIDAHLHTNFVDDGRMQQLAIAGMEAAVIPTPHTLAGLFQAEALLRLWEQFLNFEIRRGETLGFKAFVALGIPMYGLSPNAIEECLKRLPDYLTHERVVAMGEIGLDTGVENEKYLFKAQIQMAKAHNLPLILHTPIRLALQAPEVIKQVVNIIQEEKFDISKAVLDHTGESTFEYRLGTGAMVGLSVCMDKMPPEAAAGCVFNYPAERHKFIIDTEVAGGDGYFTLPMVILALKRLGMKYSEIEQVVYGNPRLFFKLALE